MEINRIKRKCGLTSANSSTRQGRNISKLTYDNRPCTSDLNKDFEHFQTSKLLIDYNVKPFKFECSRNNQWTFQTLPTNNMNLKEPKHSRRLGSNITFGEVSSEKDIKRPKSEFKRLEMA